MAIAIFRDTFAKKGDAEAIRAYALFTVLLAVVVAIGLQLLFRELSLEVLKERLDLGRAEAARIADEVGILGEADGGLDFSRVRANEPALLQFINTRIAGRLFISYVEIRDRFGARQFFVVRSDRRTFRTPRHVVPRDWPNEVEQVVRVPLTQASGVRAGEVRVGVAQDPVYDELLTLQRSLSLKLWIAAAVAVIVLTAGFLYVLLLLRKNRRLEQARQSADRASYVGLLASGLAHEIRNPLNAMNINLQMLEEELQAEPANTEEHAELLESTKREINRLDQLVRNFLQFARPAQPRFAACELNDVVSDTVRFLENDFRNSGVLLETNLAQLLPRTELDESLFRQALINLLVNARQVLRHGGRVVVATRTGAGGEVVVEIIDDGPGIPADLRDRIFEVFFTGRGGGTGLGLPIARQIVERHGGTIEVDTREGQGTTFRIRLPRRHTAPPKSLPPAKVAGETGA